jgi:hypothetical protein
MYAMLLAVTLVLAVTGAVYAVAQQNSEMACKEDCCKECCKDGKCTSDSCCCKDGKCCGGKEGMACAKHEGNACCGESCKDCGKTCPMKKEGKENSKGCCK